MGATQHQLRLVRSADNVGAQCQFNEYALADENFDGARIYLSQADSWDLLPLIVWVSGNGPPCSAFALRDGEVQQGSTSLHSFLQEFAHEKARVMVVDRQHVAFGQVWNPIDGTQAASHEFLENHTLGAWSGLIMAAIRAAWNMPTIDASRTLVVGHSDGAFVAAHIAASLPDVSHVACLAPSGLSLLWDFQYKARTLALMWPQLIRSARASLKKLSLLLMA